MKPKTKRLLAVAVVVIVVAAVVYFVFYRKSVRWIIGRLDVDSRQKKILIEKSKYVTSTYGPGRIKELAEHDGFSYNLEIVDWARHAAFLDGDLTAEESDNIRRQLYAMMP